MPEGVVVRGPLAVHAVGFGEYLVATGYTPKARGRQQRLVQHLSGWLEDAGLGVDGFTDQRILEYVAERRAQGHRELHSVRALVPLLGYLRRRGALAEASSASPPPEGPAEELLAAFGNYLRQERGLAEFTVGRYSQWAGAFLEATGKAPTPDQLRAADVHAFVLKGAEELSIPAAKQVVSALRALLRFLQVSGRADRDLTGAVPGVAGFASHLPRSLRPEEVEALLGSCNRSTENGLRDYAVLLLLARLGLRCAEVAALRLEDVDWRRGEVVVRGKGRRDERLPLPNDVGAALSAYLQRRRPEDRDLRGLFLSVHAPRRQVTRGAVGGIAVRAGRVAGLEAAGAHRLRHSLATGLLRQGASLTEVGQVLRHASVTSTAIYAKVDRLTLMALARPWPRRVP